MLSYAGFSAVPQPDHCRAASVAGVGPGCVGAALPICAHPSSFRLALLCSPPVAGTRSRTAPAAASIALLTSRDFGKPEFPVTKILPLRRATNAPVGTFTHHTFPV